jgi:hypothetical protein
MMNSGAVLEELTHSCAISAESGHSCRNEWGTEKYWGAWASTLHPNLMCSWAGGSEGIAHVPHWSHTLYVSSTLLYAIICSPISAQNLWWCRKAAYISCWRGEARWSHIGLLMMWWAWVTWWPQLLVDDMASSVAHCRLWLWWQLVLKSSGGDSKNETNWWSWVSNCIVT